MNPPVSRRDLFRAGTQGALTVAAFAGVPGGTAKADPPKPGANTGMPWPGYPRQDQKLVAEVVGVAHFDVKRVQELVKAYP